MIVLLLTVTAFCTGLWPLGLVGVVYMIGRSAARGMA